MLSATLVHTNVLFFDWKQTMFAYVNYCGIRSWNQPMLNKKDKVSCSMKQQQPLMWLGSQRVRR